MKVVTVEVPVQAPTTVPTASDSRASFIWGISPFLSTMTAREAAALAACIRPKAAVPTHYGCIVGNLSDGDTFAAALPPDISCVRLIG